MKFNLNCPTKMQILQITVSLAIHHLKTSLYRCKGRCSTSPRRCNPSMQSWPCSRAPTMLLIISVSLGHFLHSVILYSIQVYPNKGTDMDPAQVHMVTNTHKQNCLQCLVSCVISTHAQAVRQRSKVFITIDVRIHNKK